MFMSNKCRKQIANLIKAKDPIKLAFVFYHDTRKFGPDIYISFNNDLDNAIDLVTRVAKNLGGWKPNELKKFNKKIRELFRYANDLDDEGHLNSWTNTYLLKQVSPKYRQRKGILPTLSDEHIKKFLYDLFNIEGTDNKNEDFDKNK